MRSLSLRPIYPIVVMVLCVVLDMQFPPLRRRKGQKAEVCYSPSRPLDMAWRECEAKGFMLVKAVFSDDVIE